MQLKTFYGWNSIKYDDVSTPREKTFSSKLETILFFLRSGLLKNIKGNEGLSSLRTKEDG